MYNLETFVWDMPTGIVRDVWLALASLGRGRNGQDCRLERVWIRWHDNSDAPPALSLAHPLSGNLPPIHAAYTLNANTATAISQQPSFSLPSYPRIDCRTFSILPPLKSLSVLDIDELPYAEELSVLIERSLPKLRELRIGIARHAAYDVWVRPAEDAAEDAPPVGNIPHQLSRPGGILGLLTSRIGQDTSRLTGYSESAMRAKPRPIQAETVVASNFPPELPQSSCSKIAGTNSGRPDAVPSLNNLAASQEELASSFSEQRLEERTPSKASPTPSTKDLPGSDPSSVCDDSNTSKEGLQPTFSSQGSSDDQSRPTISSADNVLPKLGLEVLELERVPLSIPVLMKVIDWSRIMCLTILGCRNHEQLWRILHQKFTPPIHSHGPSPRAGSSNSSLKITIDNLTPCPTSSACREYALRLRRIHTDAVPGALISVIKETLPPDSLEWLFLQDVPQHKSNVSVDTIFRKAVLRHRGSLKKLLIDSRAYMGENMPEANLAWKKWMANREVLTFITSGKLPVLRELGISIDYKDWHYFLQRLPHMPQLRSLYIPFVAERVPAARSESRELAMQVLDTVTLHPELELCYLGIHSKCFEILEVAPGYRPPSSDLSSNSYDAEAHGDDDDDDDSDDDDADVFHSPTLAATAQSGGYPDDESEWSSSQGGDSDDEYIDPTARAAKQFKLRAILFYDDKVSIFKARHGRL